MSTEEMLKKKYESFDTATESYGNAIICFRDEKRSLWNKIILLSSAIIGFSVTMSSVESLPTYSFFLLKFSWALFMVNILCGLALLKKESEFEREQKLASLSQEWDKIELTIPVKTQEDKDKFLALTYLHCLRVTPPEENPFSKKATDIFEKNKKSLTSWQMIKNPEKFYSYSHMKNISLLSNYFYGSFTLSMIFLIVSVAL
jgi:hypothetical protein